MDHVHGPWSAITSPIFWSSIRGTWSGVITSWPLNPNPLFILLSHPSKMGSFSMRFQVNFRLNYSQFSVKNSWFSLNFELDFHWFSLIFHDFIINFQWFSLNFNQGVTQELIRNLIDFLWIFSGFGQKMGNNFIQF